MLPLYTPEMLDRYRNGSRGLPPHVFGVAYNAYHNMRDEKDSTDQSVVISGESGAGKSEATKLILQFLTDVSSRTVASSGTGSHSTQLEQQILAANPILEAFGNAKTLRNNNSSRFGKLITVNFDSNGGIIGGGIINYLLEKSRVVVQTKGERNYHIFYQLLSAAHTNPTLADQLKLSDAKLFDFTSQSGVINIDGVSDEKEFEEVQNSMNVLSFSTEERHNVFKVVAGVLHFGNAKFKVVKNATSEDSSAIGNPEVVQLASSLWGIDPPKMEKFLTNKNVGEYLVPYNIQAAQDARDAMVKRVYADLFQFIVNKINVELSSGGKKRHRFIGVLDIFGFESFEVNSFEQLCINFCNEKLQFHFNEHIFKMEQALYAAEGITIPGSSFVDNQPTLDLLELKTTGIFSMCDEEISVPRGSDEGFLQKVLTKHGDGKHPNCIRPKTAKDCKDPLKNFGVLHYAGAVYYNVTNFLEKNKDQLHPDIVNVLRESTMPLITSMFPAEEGGKGGKGAPPKKVTLGLQFKTQLNDLVATLNSTHPHFVRCMKSNDKKQGNIFASGRMQDQLRYAGLVEVCRIRKLGYPVRRLFDEFYKRFKCCDLTCTNLDALLASLKKKGVLQDGEWAKGKNRVFMRTAQGAALELAREDAFKVVVKVVQKVARGYINRMRYKNFKRILNALKDAIVKREEGVLSKAIDMTFELPHGGSHLKILKDAKALHSRLKEENRVTKLLENAIAIAEINALSTAIAATVAMSPPFAPPVLGQAKELLVKLEAELECKNALIEAINSKSLDALTSWVAKAEAMGLSCPEVQQAKTLKNRLAAEKALLENLRSAVGSKNLDSLSTFLAQCVELGMESHPDVVAAKNLEAALIKERGDDAERRAKEEAAKAKRAEAQSKANAELVAAMASCDMTKLNAALDAAVQMGLQTSEVQQAQDMLKGLNNAGDFKKNLDAIVNVLKMKAESGITDDDVAPLVSLVQGGRMMPNPPADLGAAIKALDTYKGHSKARTDLIAGIANKDRLKLRGAMELAENLDMQIDEVAVARELLRNLEVQYRTDKASGAVEEELEPYDAAEEARKKRQETAKQARFDVKNFPGLRSSDDFAKGALLNKAKIKETFLTFQPNVIPKSLLDLDKDKNKLAMQMHKNMLGYMGDKKMPFPPMLAHDILRKGFEFKAIRDEIYLQIIKQLTNNPRPESVAKGWQIMCMCVGTFPPSFDFENYLLHYIIEKRDKGRGAVVDYARYCLRTLEAMLISGDGTGFVPSVEEIQAYTDRPPILATIYLVDGNVITEDLPLTPDLNVGKVLEMCAGWLDLKDPRLDTLGLFVYDLGETDDAATMDEALKRAPYNDLPRTPRPLRNDDYMGDVIVQKARQRRKFKFVLKKKIFLPQHFGRGNDPFFERLIYLQAEDETIIQGNLDIDDEDKVAHLAAISMAVAFGEEMGHDFETLQDQNILDFIVPSWRNLKSAEEWAELILSNRDALVVAYPEDLQDQFLQVVQESPLYGMHWFHTHRVTSPGVVPDIIKSLPDDVLLGYNAEGMHLYNNDRVLLAGFPYADIIRWGGSSSQFSLILTYQGFADSFELTFITGQAADMAAIILDHIRAIMAEQSAEDEEQ